MMTFWRQHRIIAQSWTEDYCDWEHVNEARITQKLSKTQTNSCHVYELFTWYAA